MSEKIDVDVESAARDLDSLIASEVRPQSIELLLRSKQKQERRTNYKGSHQYLATPFLVPERNDK